MDGAEEPLALDLVGAQLLRELDWETDQSASLSARGYRVTTVAASLVGLTFAGFGLVSDSTSIPGAAIGFALAGHVVLVVAALVGLLVGRPARYERPDLKALDVYLEEENRDKPASYARRPLWLAVRTTVGSAREANQAKARQMGSAMLLLVVGATLAAVSAAIVLANLDSEDSGLSDQPSTDADCGDAPGEALS